MSVIQTQFETAIEMAYDKAVIVSSTERDIVTDCVTVTTEWMS